MFDVNFYKTSDGESPVEQFLEGRTEKEMAKVTVWINKLEEQGPKLPRPLAAFLRDGIHELRLTLKGDEVRILYFFIFQEFIFLTNSFIKNVSRVPESEINKALKCKRDIERRYPTKEDFIKALENNEY